MLTNKKWSVWCFLLLLSVLGCKKEDLLNVTAVTNPEAGIILVSPFKMNDNNSGRLMILNEKGELIKEKKTAGQANNFQRWVVNGKIIYSYHEHIPSMYHIPNVNTLPGEVVLLDTGLNEIKRIRTLPYESASLTSDALDLHDFILINENHYLVMSYYEKAVNNIPAALKPVQNAKIAAPIIQEIKDGVAVWEWDGSDFPEFYQNSVEGNKFNDGSQTDDYMHINSMFIDPTDGNLICSFRNLDQVVKIQRTTGNILWRLGGANSDFVLTSEQKFYRQHHATLADDNKTLLIFDNGLKGVRDYSRIIEFGLDEVNKTVKNFTSFNLPGNSFSEFMGSVQKRGDTYFIGQGSDPVVSEVNYKTGEVKLKVQLSDYSYRAFKY
ncbi:MAG: aryl-sulfate sulfotransferase [Flavisolibacter sp.]|nr:aryl-sulfate sulfotransferase [Flavisolibacter sp.]MBD0367311.1 aryl-sulfate sulfotransferase [Flavisolibacter sp.]